MVAQADIREYEAGARSTDVAGRVMCSVRNHYFVVDGPVQNGFPGEEITPSELFLAAVASCGVVSCSWVISGMVALLSDPQFAGMYLLWDPSQGN